MQTARISMTLTGLVALLALLFASVEPRAESTSSLRIGDVENVASSGPVKTILFERAYCEVSIGNIHYSPNHRDASARTSTACYFNSGNGSPFRAENISFRTYVNSTECISRNNRNTDRATMPCHAPFTGYGNYTASTNVRVTIAGATKGTSVSVTKHLP